MFHENNVLAGRGERDNRYIVLIVNLFRFLLQYENEHDIMTILVSKILLTEITSLHGITSVILPLGAF